MTDKSADAPLAVNRLFSLTCGHCAASFLGTYKQEWNKRRAGTTPFCSAICRMAFLAAKLRTPIPNRGPCRNCKASFFSRREKLFCSLKCYTGSGQFSALLAAGRAKAVLPQAVEKRAAKRRQGRDVHCLECGDEFYQKRARSRRPARKFCTTVCYRSYLAKRFDRFIANPETLALPQNFDEFLDREELPCLVEGCGWTGQHLSVHANAAHGIQADDFKRATGFNLHSGLIGRDLAKRLSERARQGVALEPDPAILAMVRRGVLGERSLLAYASLEGREHRAKARALVLALPGPSRTCRACGILFQQTTPFGRTLYCTRDCRDRFYSAELKRLARQPRGSPGIHPHGGKGSASELGMAR
jgi:hypothetical protein